MILTHTPSQSKFHLSLQPLITPVTCADRLKIKVYNYARLVFASINLFKTTLLDGSWGLFAKKFHYLRSTLLFSSCPNLLEKALERGTNFDNGSILELLCCQEQQIFVDGFSLPFKSLDSPQISEDQQQFANDANRGSIKINQHIVKSYEDAASALESLSEENGHHTIQALHQGGVSNSWLFLQSIFKCSGSEGEFLVIKGEYYSNWSKGEAQVSTQEYRTLSHNGTEVGYLKIETHTHIDSGKQRMCIHFSKRPFQDQ